MNLKHIILFTGLSISIFIEAQIGINTDNPKQILHIDGASSVVTTNPSSGNISDTQAVDDVVITDEGNVGVGVLSPEAKLHISSTTSTPAMLIADGAQGNEKILRSDANGFASWVNQPSSGGFFYNILGGATYPNQVESLVKAMSVTETGNYLVIIRWWGLANSTFANSVSAYFYLDESNDNTAARGTMKDGIEYYVYTFDNHYFTLTTCLYASASAGNYLKIFIRPSLGGDWIIGQPLPQLAALNPSIVLFKI